MSRTCTAERQVEHESQRDRVEGQPNKEHMPHSVLGMQPICTVCVFVVSHCWAQGVNARAVLRAVCWAPVEEVWVTQFVAAVPLLGHAAAGLRGLDVVNYCNDCAIVQRIGRNDAAKPARRGAGVAVMGPQAGGLVDGKLLGVG